MFTHIHPRLLFGVVLGIRHSRIKFIYGYCCSLLLFVRITSNFCSEIDTVLISIEINVIPLTAHRIFTKTMFNTVIRIVKKMSNSKK